MNQKNEMFNRTKHKSSSDELNINAVGWLISGLSFSVQETKKSFSGFPNRVKGVAYKRERVQELVFKRTA